MCVTERGEEKHGEKGDLGEGVMMSASDFV